MQFPPLHEHPPHAALGNQVFRLSYPAGDMEFLFPYFSNEEEISSSPRKLVLAIHGKDRNAKSLFRHLNKRQPNPSLAPLLICPHFLIESDLIQYQLDTSWLFWTNQWNGWKYGYKSRISPIFPKSARISSFSLFDQLITHMLQRFPTIQEVVLLGHSSGGQMIHRYAAATALPEQWSAHHFRFICINAGTYLYFSPERPHPFRKDQWFIPKDCPGYDRYKYGLSDYHNCAYIKKMGAMRIRQQYPKRLVDILVGQDDNDPQAPGIDNNNCRERLQGYTRLDRAQRFFQHLISFFGNQIENYQRLIIAPNCSHNFRHFVKYGVLDQYL